MPYAIERKDDKFAIINTDTGEAVATHATHAKADAELKALYANEPAAKSGARNSKRDKLTIRDIRKQALALADLTRELEPDDTDETADEPETDMTMESIASLLGDNTMIKSVYAVKSIGQDEVKGYLALWGDPAKTDLDTEYFTPQTDFWDTALKNSGYKPPLTWDHAQDESFKANPQIGVITEFGDDEIGRWYVAKLDRSHKYRKAIDALIKAGKLGTSSDSAPQYVERVKTGKSTWLKTWPLFAAALTDQPCEPRMLTDGSLEYLKSIGVDLPAMKEFASDEQRRGFFGTHPEAANRDGDALSKAQVNITANTEKLKLSGLSKQAMEILVSGSTVSPILSSLTDKDKAILGKLTKNGILYKMPNYQFPKESHVWVVNPFDTGKSIDGISLPDAPDMAREFEQMQLRIRVLKLAL